MQKVILGSGKTPRLIWNLTSKKMELQIKHPYMKIYNSLNR